ncbi:MAG: uroporphyrinogen-III synthase [Erythrobacter sp.]
MVDSRKVLVLRPEPGCRATLTAARALGLAAHGHPLSEIVPVAWENPDPASVDALLIGSANVFAHGGAQLHILRDKPCYVVGKATADAARAAGFAVAQQGEGGLQKVLSAIAPPLRMLRVAGEEHIALSAPQGVTITTRIAYRSATMPLDAAVPLLASGGVIALLHSAATARHFAKECQRLGVDRSQVVIAALGPRIAAAVGAGWCAVHSAPTPDDAALLEMARNLCNDT